MQTKIMFLVVGLVAFITVSSFGVFAYLDYNDIEEEPGDKALTVFFTRPIALSMLIVAFLSFLVPIICQKKTTSA
jgi:hypothetical protein